MGNGKKAAIRKQKEEKQGRKVLWGIAIALLVLFVGFFIYCYYNM